MIMRRKLVSATIFGILLGFISILISWALMVESSPLYQDALRPGWGRWLWQIANLPAFVSIVVSKTEALGVIVMITQWFLMGFLGTVAVQCFSRDKSRTFWRA
jgi:hypothetical protein